MVECITIMNTTLLTHKLVVLNGITVKKYGVYYLAHAFVGINPEFSTECFSEIIDNGRTEIFRGTEEECRCSKKLNLLYEFDLQYVIEPID